MSHTATSLPSGRDGASPPRRRILVLHNYELLRAMFCRLVEDLGFEACPAGGIEGAWELLHSKGPFTAILARWELDQCTAWDLSRQLRERDDHTPFLCFGHGGGTYPADERFHFLEVPFQLPNFQMAVRVVADLPPVLDGAVEYKSS